MSIKPIDFKTTVLGTDDASRIQEHQKKQDGGQGALVAQNRDKDEIKNETVQNTQATDGKVLRKEDEESERRRGPPDKERKDSASDQPEDEEKKPVSDGLRGIRIDVKA